ncbi:toprim domain-containing protein, partial [Acinetobacter sp. ULE_I064]|uniref:toprim domain-containing protein n=1 Tax=Acinetobacter sp. ULE_I064 TaxID=3373071 RepID=UPI003AF84182
MRLFIAEKPDIAKAIRDALGGGKQQDGHYICGNDYITWCFGHMLRLADPEEYDPKYKRWNLADLPLCFMPYKKLISDDKKAQVKIILELIKKA